MKVLRHTINGYEWEGDDGRRAEVRHAGKTSKLTLMGGKGKSDDVAGTYSGEPFACQAIALTWVQGMTPGSNAINWKPGREPKAPAPIASAPRQTRRRKAA